MIHFLSFGLVCHSLLCVCVCASVKKLWVLASLTEVSSGTQPSTETTRIIKKGGFEGHDNSFRSGTVSGILLVIGFGTSVVSMVQSEGPEGGRGVKSTGDHFRNH